MGKGLSPLQRQILEVLDDFPRWPHVGDGPAKHASTGKIVVALGRDKTPSNYVSVSKALRRLEERDLILRLAAQCRLQGSGYRYALPFKLAKGGG